MLLQYKKNFQISIAPIEGSRARGQSGSSHSFSSVECILFEAKFPGKKQDVMQEGK